jgi:hypothetical protein
MDVWVFDNGSKGPVRDFLPTIDGCRLANGTNFNVFYSPKNTGTGNPRNFFAGQRQPGQFLMSVDNDFVFDAGKPQWIEKILDFLTTNTELVRHVSLAPYHEKEAAKFISPWQVGTHKIGKPVLGTVVGGVTITHPEIFDRFNIKWPDIRLYGMIDSDFDRAIRRQNRFSCYWLDAPAKHKDSEEHPEGKAFRVWKNAYLAAGKKGPGFVYDGPFADDQTPLKFSLIPSESSLLVPVPPKL